MAKTPDSMLEAIRRYQSKHDEIRFRVPSGQKEQIQEQAKKRGFSSLSAYLKHLVDKDMHNA